MKFFKQFFSSLIILLLIFSCSLPRVYEVVVSQGNLIDEDMMEKLEVGMTESQVKYVLGSPLITDTLLLIDGTITLLLRKEIKNLLRRKLLFILKTRSLLVGKEKSRHC